MNINENKSASWNEMSYNKYDNQLSMRMRLYRETDDGNRKRKVNYSNCWKFDEDDYSEESQA